MARDREWVQARCLLDDVAKTNAINVDGIQYLKVKDRVWVFREIFGGEYDIHTDVDIRQYPSGICAFAKAWIKKDGNIAAMAHGLAWSQENMDAFVELSETRAVGRALAFFGLGGESIASFEEMEPSELVPPTTEQGPKLIVSNPLTLKDVQARIDDTKSHTELLAVWAKLKGQLENLKDAADIEKAKIAFAEKLQQLKEEDNDDTI